MYAVQFKASKVIACRFTDRAMAKSWYDLNNFDPESGEDLGLFQVVKLPDAYKDALKGSKKAQD
jgi:hypothetical protein